MVEEGLVEVYLGSDFSSEERMLPADEARRSIHDRAFWEWSAPERGAHIRALASRAGADWYLGRHREPDTSADS